MKIAITGGAGFIGTHLTRAYLDAGYDVLVIDTFINGSSYQNNANTIARPSLDPRARLYQIDIRDGRLATILQHERPDIVSHHVGQREPIMPTEQALIDADLHVRGLLNVLDACISASVSKFIFASSGNDLYTCVDANALPLKEDATLCPRCPSAISKVAGEWYVRYYTQQYGLVHTILRYADIYGDRNDEHAQHPIHYFVKMLLEDARPVIRGTGQDRRDTLFIDDVVEANLCALERGKNVTVHISSGHAYDLNQFYATAAHLLQSDLVPVYVSASSSQHRAASTLALDNTLAQQVLGWHPHIPLSEGIQCVIDHAAPRLWSTSRAESYEQELIPVSQTPSDTKGLLDAPLALSPDPAYTLSTVKETEHLALATALA